MYVGTDLGIWKTVDGAVQWTYMGSADGLPNAPVVDLQMNPLGLIAFTHGRGAFRLQ
jgi:hypothetical protein